MRMAKASTKSAARNADMSGKKNMKFPAWFNRPLTTMMMIPAEAADGPAVVAPGVVAHPPVVAPVDHSNHILSQIVTTSVTKPKNLHQKCRFFYA